jgi:hypothetical protein
MKRFVLHMFVLIAIGAVQDAPAQQKTSCDKPYRIGHFVSLGSEDLRLDRSRAISKKEMKDWDKKQFEAQRACNAFVGKHPNLSVSEDFSFTVKGFITVHERCDSFCGTGDDLRQLYEREIPK